MESIGNRNTSGTPPAGFTYGYELTTSTDILADEYTSQDGSHGTNVAAVAGGSANGKAEYEGIAPNTDLVFVEAENVPDGLNYVFNYAKSVSKPCIINMSLGSHIGPHDGTSSTDKVIDQLASEGQIIVGACGNEGSTKLHIGHNFLGDTIYIYPLLSEGNQGFTTVDMWGEKGKDFSVQVDIWSNTLQMYIYSSDFFSTSINDNDDTVITVGPDRAELSFSGESSSPLNQKSHFQVEYSLNNSDYEVYINVTSSSDMVHMWNNTDGNGGDFSLIDGAGQTLTGFTGGVVEYTAGEIGATANDIIAVGAYTSNNNFTGLNSVVTTSPETLGDIAEFSSNGPTADGRVKPHITAPGNNVIAAVNSFDNKNYLFGGASEDEIVAGTTFNSKTYYYAGLQGTSMASPTTAGVVALLLSLDPNLTPDRVKTLLKENAITDGFTGTIPAVGSNVWGHGKVDVHASMTALEGQVAAIFSDEVSNGGLNVYPNPVKGRMNIEAEAAIVSIRVIDLTGKVLAQQELNAESSAIQLDTEEYKAGVFMLEVNTVAGSDVIRIVKR